MRTLGARARVWTGLVNPQAGLGQVRGELVEGWALFRAKYAIYPKPGSNREGKNAYMAKSYGTLYEYES